MSISALRVDESPDENSLNDRLLSLLYRVDYRVAVTDADKEEIFQLRYEAYRREDGIAPRFDSRLSDHYDDLDTTTIVGMYIDGELASTIRATLVTAEFPESPAMEVFDDILGPKLAAGQVLIDPTRHATKAEFSHRFPTLLPYLTTRAPWMMCEYHNVDGIVAWVRPEHRAFYRRTFGFRQLSDPRTFPTLLRPQCLTFGEYRQLRDDVHRRLPSFRSSAFERRMLVEAHGASVPSAPRVAAHPLRAEPEVAALARF